MYFRIFRMNLETVLFTRRPNKKLMRYLSESELLGGVEYIKKSPRDCGTLELIVIRPKKDERFVLSECALSSRLGVHGDNWALGCWRSLPDGSPHPDVQVTLMNSRCIALLAQEKSRWALAGDNLFVDLDLRDDNLPCGQRLAIGTVVLEITDQAHNGCKKFSQRYGPEAVKFVNSTLGKQLHLRGIYAKIVQDGDVKVGDRCKKI
jgi:hypothetical protein